MITSNSPIDFISMNNSLNKSSENEEILQSPEFKEWLLGLLSDDNPTTITFLKKDSTERRMVCTRNFDKIPVEHHPKNSMKITNGDSIPVFDLEKQEWRSFIVSSIKRIEYSFGV